MLDFTDLPKQWLIAPELPGDPVAGKRDAFAGWQIAAAEVVPILQLCDAAGAEVGRLIGWVIDGTEFHRADATLTLTPGETPEDRFARLAGRFVMLWCGADGRLRLREDASGGLPAVHVPEARLIGSTVTLLDQLHALEVDPEIEAIFDFPARRGFLPFGLTPRRGAHRLMPNHVLELDGFTTARVWPDPALCARPDLNEVQIAALVDEAADILRRHMAAILSQGETVLYLSGGHDSRISLSAARDHTDRLFAQTFGDVRSLDAHVAQQVAKQAGIRHELIPLKKATSADVQSWLHRSGRMTYSAVSRFSVTAVANAPLDNPVGGTGAELIRGSNWNHSDIDRFEIDFDTLRIGIYMPYMPDHPLVRSAGNAWLYGLPNMDSAMALDLAKIEQIHGCWSGTAVYGHPMFHPTIFPFSGQRLNEIVLSMPKTYRRENKMFSDLLRHLWPDLLEVPVNRATGLARLRFWREEARAVLPGRIKRALKALR